MKRFALPLLAALTLLSQPASAAIFNLGPLGPPDLEIFGNSFDRTQHFEDVYNFSLAGGATAFGGTLEFDLSFLRSIDITSVSLSGGNLSGTLVDTSPLTFSFSNLLAGNYQLVIAGDVTGSNGGGILGGPVGYTGSIATIASPVPEPSTWAMMILGFAGVGYMTYRRRKTAARAA
jgi:hypothetical protein